MGIGSSGVKSGDSRMMNGMGSKRIKDLEMMPCGKCSKSSPTMPHISATTTPKYFPPSTPRHKELISCHSWQNLNESRLLDLEAGGDHESMSVLWVQQFRMPQIMKARAHSPPCYPPRPHPTHPIPSTERRVLGIHPLYVARRVQLYICATCIL